MNPLRRRRAVLLIGTAAAALVTGRAGAQAFQGNFVNTAGAAVRQINTATTETIVVTTPSAILTWTPSDSAIGGPPIDFLPAGNFATFTNGPGLKDFIVLNRILPKDLTRSIQLNGTILSQLQSAGNTARGGTVAFFSPAGILVGSKAVIDVGSLLLTTIDPKTDVNGNFFVGNSYALTGAVSSKSLIQIAAGAQISALNEGSYVAIAAPIVEQHGSIQVNGSIALVAAEAVTLTINNGLFDIQVSTGSSSGTNTLVHDGTTGGPASTGAAGDNHRIYLVAVPKNQAITALLQGNVGFAAASSAAIQNGEIILSAGRSVTSADAFKAAPTTPDASFRIQGGAFTSDVLGSAITDFIVDSANANTSFSGNVNLTGDQRARIEPAAGRTVGVTGNLILRSDGTDQTRSPGMDNVGGDSSIVAAGSTVTVGGNVALSAIGRGGFDSSGNIAGSGTGGTAALAASAGGAITISGNLLADARGFGGSGGAPAMQGGAGKGGTASISATGASVNVAGTTSLDAGGSGSDTAGGFGLTGPTGTGGTASVSTGPAGSVKLTGAAILAAAGTGGAIVSTGGGTGGAGQGGSAKVQAAGGPITFSSGGQVLAPGFGAAGSTGGAGTGGKASVEATEATLTLGGATSVLAEGQGGGPGVDAGGTGGDGKGGSASVIAHNGKSASLVTGAGVTVSADGRGSAGGNGNAGGGSGGPGGRGDGGDARLLAESDNAGLAFAAASVSARGTGGAGGAGVLDGAGASGGNGHGGTASAGTSSAAGNQFGGGGASFASLAVNATATGGAGGNGGTTGAPSGDGGSVTGGTASLFSRTAPVNIAGAATLDSSATGGIGGVGTGTPGNHGVALGGTVIAGATRDDAMIGAGSLKAASLTGTANAVGDSTNDNMPGAWEIVADNGAVQLGTLTLTASSTGIPANRPASSFTLTDGIVSVTGAANATSGGNLVVTATGTGKLGAASLALAAPFGAISITHSGRAPGAATIDAGDFAATSRDAFTAAPGTRLVSTASTAIDAGGAIQVDEAAAGTNFAAATPGTITITGAAGGRDMSLRSSDIVIGAAATLGGAATKTVLLDIVTNGEPALVGGSAAGAGYTLDSSEIGRIRTAALTLQAPVVSAVPVRPADIVLRDFSLSGSDGGLGLELHPQHAGPGAGRGTGALPARRADRLLRHRRRRADPGGDAHRSDPAHRRRRQSGRHFVARFEPDQRHRRDDGAPASASGLAARRGGPAPGQSRPGQPSGLSPGQCDRLHRRKQPLHPQHRHRDRHGRPDGRPGRPQDPRLGRDADRRRRLRPERLADGTFLTGLQFFALIDFGKGAGTSYTNESEFNRCNINNGCPPPPPPPPPPPASPTAAASAAAAASSASTSSAAAAAATAPPPPPPPPVKQALLAPDVRAAVFVLGPMLAPQLPPLAVAELIDLALGPDFPLDEPVTSGGDSVVWDKGKKP
jgi:filamentous hemagglutinin family protein